MVRSDRLLAPIKSVSRTLLVFSNNMVRKWIIKVISSSPFFDSVWHGQEEENLEPSVRRGDKDKNRRLFIPPAPRFRKVIGIKKCFF